MTKERYLEIYNEAYKRIKLWLKHSTFAELTGYGSDLRFQMNIGLLGYPLGLEEWMNEEDFKLFITKEEYESNEMTVMFSILYDVASELSYINN